MPGGGGLILDEDTINAAMNRAMANFGAPNQMVLNPAAFNNLRSFFGIEQHPIMAAIKGKLHGKLKLGTITWNDNNAIEAAAKALEAMGVFRHAPKIED